MMQRSHNHTPRVDRSGQKQHYADLQPGESYVQSTYGGHVWALECPGHGVVRAAAPDKDDRLVLTDSTLIAKEITATAKAEEERPPAVTRPRTLVGELKKLKEDLDGGSLSQEEYDAAKAELTAEMTARLG